ncbi:MAG: carbohydrate ABC transporter permease [Dehalococcoidia bacterium]
MTIADQDRDNVSVSARKAGRRRAGQLFPNLVAVLVLFVMFFPFVWMFLSSLKTNLAIFTRPPVWLPPTITFEHYRALWDLTQFPRYLINTFVVAGSAVAVGVSVALAAVYSISRFKFMAQDKFTFLVLTIYMMPPILLAIPIFGIWFRLGWTNSLAGLMFTYLILTLPFSVWILRPYLETIPRELEEAAMVDGCTRFRAFRKVIIPQAIPGIITASVFTFVLAWNELLYALVLISDEGKRTISLGIAQLILEQSIFSWGMVNAAGVAATVPVLLLFILVSRRMVAGLTQGGVKG